MPEPSSMGGRSARNPLAYALAAAIREIAERKAAEKAQRRRTIRVMPPGKKEAA